jgi:hypothetical protein
MLLLLPWLSLPLVAAVYLLLWDRLPEHLIVQLDHALRPTISTTRGQSLAFDLAILLFILVTGNLKMRGKTGVERTSTLGVMLLAVTFCTLVFFGLLVYNIKGSLF